jgi:hypothetical protein
MDPVMMQTLHVDRLIKYEYTPYCVAVFDISMNGHRRENVRDRVGRTRVAYRPMSGVC